MLTAKRMAENACWTRRTGCPVCGKAEDESGYHGGNFERLWSPLRHCAFVREYRLLELSVRSVRIRIAYELSPFRRNPMTARLWGILLTFLCFGIFAGAQSADAPKGRLPYQLDQQFKARTPRKTSTILYHGGPVMVAPTNLYIVYYGSFTANQHAILDTFLQNLGGTGAFNVNTEYYNSQNQFIQNI